MKIRRLEIENFRGIKSLTWDVPNSSNLLCLIGPGDSGKSTILDAIHWLLGDRWSLPVSDSDFHGADTDSPIAIRAILDDPPKSLLKESAFGLWLTGIDAAGKLESDPEDGFEPCLYVELIIDDSLEPRWHVRRLDPDLRTNLTSAHRKNFATFKVDDRLDIHFRWSRTSSLGRMSLRDGSANNAMALASRAARQAIANLEDEDLSSLAATVQIRVNEVGAGTFADIKPGLDTSLSSTSGNLALYDGQVPLSNFGLGTKRIAGMAVQQLAAGERSILLVDEIEHGLEPHRLVNTIRHLASDDRYDQVFITTHSNIAVEQATIASLVVVRNADGITQTKSLRWDDEDTVRLRRSKPSSFLGQRIVVTEGKTEEGILRASVDYWDARALEENNPIAAGYGVVLQDGQGGSDAVIRARVLADLGYTTLALVDNDDSSIDKHVQAAESAGVPVLRWTQGNNTERELCNSLAVDGLTSMLGVVVGLRGGGETTVLQDLYSNGLPRTVRSLDVADWGLSLGAARDCIAKAASGKAHWFKDVDSGVVLGEWIIEHKEMLPAGCLLLKNLSKIRDFVYPGESAASDA